MNVRKPEELFLYIVQRTHNIHAVNINQVNEPMSVYGAKVEDETQFFNSFVIITTTTTSFCLGNPKYNKKCF